MFDFVTIKRCFEINLVILLTWIPDLIRILIHQILWIRIQSIRICITVPNYGFRPSFAHSSESRALKDFFLAGNSGGCDYYGGHFQCGVRGGHAHLEE